VRYIIAEKLVDILKTVNKKECDVLSKKIISKECFFQLANYLEKKNMKFAAFILRFFFYTDDFLFFFIQ
jgi:hypothetical protein